MTPQDQLEIEAGLLTDVASAAVMDALLACDAARDAVAKATELRIFLEHVAATLRARETRPESN